MTTKIGTGLLVAALLSLPTAASATGGLSCSVDDKNLEFTFESVFSYSDIGGLFQITGELQSKDKRTYEALRKFALDGTELKQQWFRGDDLKLMIYRETEGDGVPHASVKLIIEAIRSPGDEIEYSGKYALTIQPAVIKSDEEAVTLEGKITCSAG